MKREQGRLSFGAAAPERLPVRELVIGGDTRIPEAGVILHSALTVYSGEIHSSLNTFFFQYENICGTITCTPRAAGDKIRLQGRGCTKKLSDLFAERHLTQAERELVPVIRDEAGPIAVCGFGAAERVRPEKGRMALRIDVIKK